jgi:predicted transcriptional regulator
VTVPAPPSRVILRAHYLQRWQGMSLLKQKSLAHRIGVTQGYLSRLAIGIGSCTIWDAGRLVAKINFHLRHDGMRERMRLRDLIARHVPGAVSSSDEREAA